MKNLMIATSLLFVMNSFAETDATAEAKGYVAPTETEISVNRACFQDLERLGCRTIEEDPEQFRSCLSSSLQTLEENCQKLMLKLYGTK